MDAPPYEITGLLRHQNPFRPGKALNAVIPYALRDFQDLGYPAGTRYGKICIEHNADSVDLLRLFEIHPEPLRQVLSMV